MGDKPLFYAWISYDDAYVQPIILGALGRQLPPGTYHLLKSGLEQPDDDIPLLQFCSYEQLDFERAIKKKSDLINAYVIRKALIRKHFLTRSISHWLSKKPSSELKTHIPTTVDFELDYAEFLDEALLEAYELNSSLLANLELSPQVKEWWILKPGMSDRGHGIHLFGSEDELRTIFESWEEAEKSSDNGSSDEHAGDEQDQSMISQLRHFVAQTYIMKPLLFSCFGNRKFHVRVYVLAVGSLSVFVYREMLALFASKAYLSPSAEDPVDMNRHLTNTCSSDPSLGDSNVKAFWSLPDTVDGGVGDPAGQNWKEKVFSQVCGVVGETFEAAARTMTVHFQTLPNAFELFGVDLLIDETLNTWLLEINAFPDLAQTGQTLRPVIEGLFEEVVDVAIAPFFHARSAKSEDKPRMHKVLEIDLGQR